MATVTYYLFSECFFSPACDHFVARLRRQRCWWVTCHMQWLLGAYIIFKDIEISSEWKIFANGMKWFGWVHPFTGTGSPVSQETPRCLLNKYLHLRLGRFVESLSPFSLTWSALVFYVVCLMDNIFGEFDNFFLPFYNFAANTVQNELVLIALLINWWEFNKKNGEEMEWNYVNWG